jgi:flagellar protein FliT
MAGHLMGCYEAMALASRAMLRAARESDWSTVASLELHCAGLIAELGDGAAAPPLDDAQRRRRLEIVQRLLTEDAEIRNLAQPWLADLQSMLGQSCRGHETDSGVLVR